MFKKYPYPCSLFWRLSILSLVFSLSLELGLKSPLAWAEADSQDTVKPSIDTELKLKDGTVLKGQIIEQTEETIKIKTLLGVMSIPVTNVIKPSIRVKLTDGSTVQGLLMSQTEKQIQVQGVMGLLTIDRANIETFQLDFKSGATLGTLDSNAQDSTNVVDLETGRSYNGSESADFENTIEPLIDMFFDPTAYVFNQGDVYISGLSLAYGMTASSLISVNLVNLIGLNQANKVNPNIELKWQPYFKRSNTREHGMAIGIKAQTHSFNGYNQSSYAADGGLIEESKQRPNLYRSFNDYNPYQCDLDMVMVSGRSITEPYQCTDPSFGWQTQLYIAQSVSWLMQKGGRFSLHAGANIEINKFNANDWGAMPTYRVYAGTDLDLSPSIKILGEIFYDPNFRNYLTNDTGMGVDFGIVWAITKNFRLLVHTQPYILGLYWRF